MERRYLLTACFLLVLHHFAQQSGATEAGSGSGSPITESGSGSGSLLFPSTTELPTTEPSRIDGIDFLSFVNILDDDNGLLGELGKTLDGCSRPIYMNEGIPYGTGTETQLRVCSNGVISFGNTYFYYWYPDLFPTRYSRIRASNVVAVFWNDHDHRAFGSRIVYKTYKPEQGPMAAEKLGRVSEFVSHQTDEEFFGVWMMVAHWIDIPPYPYGSYYYRNYYRNIDPPRNSYQGIIITDGSKTYAVFNYNCEMIEWSGHYRHSVIGYNINSKSARGISFPYAQNNPFSGLRQAGMIACTNMERFGVSWSNQVYQIGIATDRTQMARAECLKRESKDILEFNGGIRYEAPCPCSFWQAIFDSRYSYASYRLAQITGDFSFYNSYCFVQRFRARSNRGVQLCCYSTTFNNFGALLDSSYGYHASSLLQYHPFWDRNNYVQKDYPFRENCCFDGNICEVYTRLRPADNCASYRPPRRAWCWGDPHITNLDGGVYTFNGWGEYTLLDINTPSTSFVLQGRTHPVTNSTATQLVALAFGLSIFSAVEVRLPGESDTEPLLVFFEGRSILANISNTNNTFEHENATITRGSPTSIVTSFPNGIGMIVNASAMLGFTLIVPDEYQSMGSGLSGNFNGNNTDDVVFKNGTMLTPPVSDQLIHEVGQSWRILPDESLFTYPEGMTAEDFQHPDHSPVFISDILENAPQEVLDACGDSKDCIFDAIQTGDIEIGKQTKASNQLNIVEQQQAANRPPAIHGPQIFFIILGENVELRFNVTDENLTQVNVFVANDLPKNSSLISILRDGYIEFTFEWTLEEIVNETLVFVAEDELEARSVLNVQVQICACKYDGNCTLNGIIESSASTVVLNCECPESREGLFCEDDVNGCAQTTCNGNAECVDVPAPGVGVDCGECLDGYFDDGGKCADLDECLNGTHNCAELCVNLEGSFECDCNPGHQLINVTHCEDINECSQLNGDCHQFCENYDGGFRCSCDMGYELSNDNFTCQVMQDVMCNSTNICSQACVLVDDNEVCGCNHGFMLAEDGESCLNINECEQKPCGQNSNCIDNEGSFACDCVQGYQLQVDGRQCQDVDECLVAALIGRDLCNSITTLQFCVNTLGGYKCQCPEGSEQRGKNCIDPDSLLISSPSIEDYLVFVILEEYRLINFTEELEMKFKQITAEAVNDYCGPNLGSCVFSRHTERTRRQTVMRISADNVEIADLVDSDQGQLMFSVYVENENGFLSSTDLLEAIKSHTENYNSEMFSFSAYQKVPPTLIPPSKVPSLTNEEIIGIAIGVSMAFLLIVLIIAFILFCCLKTKSKTRKQGKMLITDEEIKKIPSRKSNKITPEEDTTIL